MTFIHSHTAGELLCSHTKCVSNEGEYPLYYNNIVFSTCFDRPRMSLITNYQHTSAFLAYPHEFFFRSFFIFTAK